VTVDPDPVIVPHVALQFQLVGLPEVEALNCDVCWEQSVGPGLALTCGVPGFGLIVNVYVPAVEVPQEFVAVTLTTHCVDEVTAGAV
jgi:hypothetical protein